jgi:hypothetical protein
VESYREQWEKRGEKLLEIGREIRRFDDWWKQEKSAVAKKSASLRKRGRVKRPASDLRFKENRKHKRGYCQKCGKRTSRSAAGNYERLCDDHIKSDPIKVQKSTLFVDPSWFGYTRTLPPWKRP